MCSEAAQQRSFLRQPIDRSLPGGPGHADIGDPFRPLVGEAIQAVEAVNRSTAQKCPAPT